MRTKGQAKDWIQSTLQSLEGTATFKGKVIYDGEKVIIKFTDPYLHSNPTGREEIHVMDLDSACAFIDGVFFGKTGRL